MKSDADIKSIDDIDKKVFFYYFVGMLQSSWNANLTLNFPILGSPNTINYQYIAEKIRCKEFCWCAVLEE